MRILKNLVICKALALIGILSMCIIVLNVMTTRTLTDNELQISANTTPIPRLRCTFVFENYTAYCNFSISQFYQTHLIDDLEIMKNSSIIKLIKFENGHEINQGCSFATQCAETPHFNEFLNRTMNVPPCCRRNTLKMFREMITLLETYDFNYSLAAGSVLGLVRHHGQMIPYDDDIDLIVPEEKRQVFNNAIVPILLKNGHYIHYFSDNNMQIHIEYSKENQKTVDLFWYLIKNETVVVKDYSRYIYPGNLIFPTKQALFEKVFVRIPARPVEYVKYRYGEIWKKLKNCTRKMGHKCVT
ncbi:hypothetical protein GJ496_008898 [Pomphorhynchus laevis]|nr:hypothetical protein GJ496_008898 [Pomphorhynchus laevis]